MQALNMIKRFFGKLGNFFRKCIFLVLSVGPIPSHIAFILDGNRRYAKKNNLKEGSGHRVGFLALMSMLKYCYELGVKYITIFAFSVDNFNRKPDEVKYVMDLMREKIEELLKQESIVNRFGIRVRFIGDLKLLHEPTRVAAEKVMAATANNNKVVLLVCVAYTTVHEIVHSVQESYNEKLGGKIQELHSSGSGHENGHESAITVSEKLGGKIQELHSSGSGHENGHESAITVSEKLGGKIQELHSSGSGHENGHESAITVSDLERHMYMSVVPDPDILVRTSGANRLSNFLIWQTTHCHLYSPAALWPEISLWHLIWMVLNYQRVQPILEKRKKLV